MKASKRLLVLTYHFPPDGAVGGLRWSGLSKYLARRGWEVHVVTAAKQNAPPPPGVVVHYVGPTKTINDLYNATAKRIRARSAPTAAPTAKEASRHAANKAPSSAVTRILARVRQNVSGLMVFPDFARGWILPATRTARALLKQYDFDAVVSSGPPHSAHVAGVLACGLQRGLLTLDMRDPWAGLIEKKWAEARYAADLTRVMTRRLERMIVGRARLVIANTTANAADVQKQYPSARVAFVSNGIDYERLPAPAANAFGGVSLVYAGTLYLGRDLSPVVRGMREFLAKYPAARGALRLRLAGTMDAPLEAKFRSEVADAHLDDSIEALGQVSPQQAMDLINRSQLTLVLAQDQPTQIPAKIYECVGLGVPTLVIAEATSAAALEAHRIGAWTCDAHDVEAIAAFIERLWLDPSLRAIPTTPIGYEDIAEQMDTLLSSRGENRELGARGSPTAATRGS